tara:strand:+ start:3817 stop:6318 length:2502 start_codon:yes stop_codon:yes gene_type:complete
MATIDKALPNVTRTKIDLPSAKQKAQEIQLPQEPPKQPIEITRTEDGGAEIDFDPSAMANIGGAGQNIDTNLAEFLDDEITDPIGSDMMQNFEDYKASRDDWEQSYIKGLDLLGFKYEDRTEPFQGASGATHPVLAEAVTQFQSLAYKELLPADGPVRTRVMGKPSKARTDQAERVREFMNYQLMCEMPEYEPEFDQMLFNLPLAGSAFKKVYYDQAIGRCVSKFVPAEDLVVPYSATSLDDADTIMHIIKMPANDMRKMQVQGFYKDIELGTPAYDEDDIKSEKNDLEGVSTTNKDEVFTLVECHVELDLEGFEDTGADGLPTGIKMPYIVTVEESTQKVLSIRRNYDIQDPMKKRKDYFVHFKFLPGLGFYGFGLIHMIGGLSRTATAALRQLLDAGTLSNLPAGFKMRGIRVRDEAQPLQPGEFRDVDAPGGRLDDAFKILPFKEPSQTLLSLMGTVVAAGQRFASIADLQVGDGNQSAAVGTTVALLERGSRVMSSIHKRLYASMKKEFMLLSDVFATYLPPEYPYDVVGGQRQIKATDFDSRIDVIPVADPNIFSQTQRIQLAQTGLQMAMSNPQMHNLYSAYRTMYEALGVKDIDALLPPVGQPTPMDPSVEHINALSGKAIKAFPNQDHTAHMKAHLSFMGTQIARTNPNILAAIQKNILEHISLMAQEQVQLEFKDEMVQIQQITAQLQQMGGMNPQMMQQNPQMMQMQQQIKKITTEMESRKAVLISETMAEYLEEEKKVLNQLDNDPLLRLKADEVQLRAQENERKKQDDENQLNLDKARLLQARELAEDKMELNDKHQKLRASVSLAKEGVKEMTAIVGEEK